MLEAMIAQVIDGEASEAQLARDLDRWFGRDAAVLVIDMADFTRNTAALGIAHELVAIARQERDATPIIEAYDGRLVKADADNLLALFASASDAAAAGRLIVREGRASAGVGYGRILDLGDDLFGDEVNRASKLGEDVARHGQMLLTEAAQAALASSGDQNP